MGTLEIIYVLLSILFLLICAFFASAEIAFISLPHIKLRRLEEDSAPSSRRVARIMEHPERFLSTVLTGISFAETIVVALGTIFIVALLGEGIGTPVAIVVIAIVLLIFAKVIPKTIAAQHAERIALLYGGPIELIARLLYPLVAALSWIAARITSVVHSRTIPGALISKEEISSIISLSEEEGVVDEASAQMMRSVVRLGERHVREVMTPRTEAVWIEQGMTLEAFLKVYAQSPAQRYPVYQESYDNVKGMLSIRDVLAALAKGSIGNDSVVTDMARPIYYVPGGKTVGELFSEMREEGYLMAAVISEYGGTSGIVTVDQLVEEIVGEIGEELVKAEQRYEVVGLRTYKIHGSMHVDEANEQLKLDIPEGDYQTIGGFALSLFGHLPGEGEQIVFGDLRMMVTEIKDNKITCLFVTKERRREEEGEEKGEEKGSAEGGPPKKG